VRTHLTTLRGALSVLLVGSAILFLVGSTIERNHRHHETITPTHVEGSGGETGGETGTTEASKPPRTHTDAGHSEAGAKILGVNTESLALSIVAVVFSLLLAAAIWLGKWARLVLLGVAVFGLVFAAGDGRELAHQLTESNNGLAAVAAILLVLHLAVSAVAGVLLRPRPRVRVPLGEAT
jgi:hypothetical protein